MPREAFSYEGNALVIYDELFELPLVDQLKIDKALVFISDVFFGALVDNPNMGRKEFEELLAKQQGLDFDMPHLRRAAKIRTTPIYDKYNPISWFDSEEGVIRSGHEPYESFPTADELLILRAATALTNIRFEHLALAET